QHIRHAGNRDVTAIRSDQQQATLFFGHEKPAIPQEANGTGRVERASDALFGELRSVGEDERCLARRLDRQSLAGRTAKRRVGDRRLGVRMLCRGEQSEGKYATRYTLHASLQPVGNGVETPAL